LIIYFAIKKYIHETIDFHKIEGIYRLKPIFKNTKGVNCATLPKIND